MSDKTITCFVCGVSTKCGYEYDRNAVLIKQGWRAFTVWTGPTLHPYTASFTTQHACPIHAARLVST